MIGLDAILQQLAGLGNPDSAALMAQLIQTAQAGGGTTAPALPLPPAPEPAASREGFFDFLGAPQLGGLAGVGQLPAPTMLTEPPAIVRPDPQRNAGTPWATDRPPGQGGASASWNAIMGPESLFGQIAGPDTAWGQLWGTVAPFLYPETEAPAPTGPAFEPGLPPVPLGGLAGGAGQQTATIDLRGENPWRRAMLNAISATESPGYNVLHGGATFDDYSAHPNNPQPVAGQEGVTSTAAGKYQFIHETWQRAAQALGLTDFSPESQDAAAWWLAQQDYQSRTGRVLENDLRAAGGLTPEIAAALAPTWEGLSVNPDRAMSAFASAISGEVAPRPPEIAGPDFTEANRFLEEARPQATSAEDIAGLERDRMLSGLMSGLAASNWRMEGVGPGIAQMAAGMYQGIEAGTEDRIGMGREDEVNRQNYSLNRANASMDQQAATTAARNANLAAQYQYDAAMFESGQARILSSDDGMLVIQRGDQIEMVPYGQTVAHLDQIEAMAGAFGENFPAVRQAKYDLMFQQQTSIPEITAVIVTDLIRDGLGPAVFSEYADIVDGITIPAGLEGAAAATYIQNAIVGKILELAQGNYGWIPLAAQLGNYGAMVLQHYSPQNPNRPQ